MPVSEEQRPFRLWFIGHSQSQAEFRAFRSHNDILDPLLHCAAISM